MSKRSMILPGVGLLLVGVIVGVAGAQGFQRPQHIDTGVFSVGKGEAVNFHVSLGAQREGAPARVLLRIFDQHGAVVARDTVTLEPGQSTTLQVLQPGLYSADARAVDSALSLTDRPRVVGTVEISDIADLTIDRFVCPIHSHDEPSTNNRP